MVNLSSRRNLFNFDNLLNELYQCQRLVQFLSFLFNPHQTTALDSIFLAVHSQICTRLCKHEKRLYVYLNSLATDRPTAAAPFLFGCVRVATCVTVLKRRSIRAHTGDIVRVVAAFF